MSPSDVIVHVLPARLADDDRKGTGDGAPGAAVITKTKPQTKRPNLYRVLLLNDDYTADSESAPPCAHASARAREIIEEFSLGSIASPVRPTVSRARRYHTDHADVGAGLVGAAIGQR